MAATPTSTIVVHTPSTPRHGARYDTNHVHATRRSSRKISTSNATNAISHSQLDEQRGESRESLRNRSKGNHGTSQISSPPSSVQNTPHRKVKSRNLRMDDNPMDMDKATSRSASLDPPDDQAKHGSLLPPTANIGPNMLPTPVKTPRKKQIQHAALNAGGRILFPDRVEDPMPVSRKNKKGKRHVGFSIFGSVEEDGGPEGDIPIYTDSKDKVPELDPSEDNPFLDKPMESTPPPEPVKSRSSKKRKPAFGLDGSKEIEEAFKRDEGMVYVFRGKKIYRKFPHEDTDPEEEEVISNEINGNIESSHPRPLRRSAIKPRLLFPSAAQRARHTKSDIEDEEAPTDIDETPDKEMEADPRNIKTPIKESFAPTTPPDTGHATRSATRRAVTASIPRDTAASGSSSPNPKFSSSPPPPTRMTSDVSKRQSKKASPFDGWARTKAGVTKGLASSKSKKRGAEVLDQEVNDGGEEFKVNGTASKKAKP